MPNDLKLDAPTVASRLRMAMMRIVRQIRKQTDGEQSVSAIAALASLKRLGAITVGELADAEGVSRPSMTVLVGSLLDQGLVSKEADASDGRLVRVRTTAAGTKALDESRTRRTAYLAKRLRGLEQAELKTLDDASGILERLLEKSP
jgi:DNA-binding MarR family transcriptional regulator